MLCEICPGLLCAAWDLVPEWVPRSSWLLPVSVPEEKRDRLLHGAGK